MKIFFLCVSLFFAWVPTSRSEEEQTISPSELDRSIHEVSKRPEYTWRLPREKIASEDKGLIARFLEEVVTTIKNWFRPIKGFVQSLIDMIEEWAKKLLQRHEDQSDRNESGSWTLWLQILLFSLLGILAVTLSIVFLRAWKRRRSQGGPLPSTPVISTPDLQDENVQADQLPSDEWLVLAKDLLARGELRLALRAFYLSTLASLAQRELLSIARYKSNLDYEKELTRRWHSQPDLLNAFQQNVILFEKTWYGMHDVNPESLNRFSANMEKLKTIP
jgi:hypothetical protein